MIGAHRNLSVYGVPSAKAKPIVFLSMPIFDSQYDIVASSSVSGKPLEMPSRNAPSGPGVR